MEWYRNQEVEVAWENPIPVLHCPPYRPFATTVSKLKISEFSGEPFKGFEVL
jgi:hypothetical protein